MNFLKRILFVLLAIPCIIFINLRFRAFLYQVWKIEISDNIIFLIISLCFIFKECIYNYIKKFKLQKFYKNIVIYIICLILSVTFRNIFIYTAIEPIKIKSTIILVFSILGCAVFLTMFFNSIFLITGHIYNIFTKNCVHIKSTDIIFIFLMVLFINMFSIIYIKNLKTIFFWDNAGYWTTTNMLSDIFFKNFYEFISKVYYSVLTVDYNYVIAVPLSIIAVIFGKSRAVFIMGIINIYLIPTIIIIFVFIKSLYNKAKIITLCILLTFPYLIFISLTGFVDIAGIILTVSIFFIYQKSNKKGFNIEMTTIGFMLALSVILRRWYSFFALSFIIAVLIDSLFFKKAIDNFMNIIISFGFILLFFFQTFVSKILLANYKNLYSAYSLGIKIDYFIFVRYFGIIILLIFIVYSVICLFISKYRANSIFSLIQFIVCFFIFTNVQNHGQQHLLLYIPMIIYILSLFYNYIITYFKESKIILIACIFLSIFPTINTFIIREQPTTAKDIKKHAFLPDFSIYPPYRKDTDEILLLAQWLDSEIGIKNKTVSILSSSFILNKDILVNAELSLSKKRKYNIERNDYILNLSDVDKRDGFPFNIFTCDYVVVPYPVQIHLSPKDQRTITIPAQYFYNNIGFARAFKKLQFKFYISNDIEVFIFEKIRDITEEEKQQLLDELNFYK